MALVVALLILKATHGSSDPIWWWWWYPLPAFVVPTVVVGIPLLPPSENQRFRGGPKVPTLLAGFEAHPQTLEAMLETVLRGLQASWAKNETLLIREAQCLKWGIILFSVITATTIGLYAWGLS